MKQQVGIGIIGTGFARRVQIPAFLACENARVISVASGRIENAESAAKEFGIEHFTADWRATIENENVDLVCITTPPGTHFEMTRAAIKAGKHVLCEKPMAMSAAEARAMTELAKEKQILTLIDHELRFLYGRRRAFEMLRSGAIGKIRHAKANFRAPHRGDTDSPWNWWSDKQSGGGALGAIGSHIIDSFNWFLGAEIGQVFCQLQTHIKQRKDPETGEMREVSSDDEANLILRFADGDLTTDATGNVSISVTEYPKYQNRMEFFGSRGAIRVEARGEVFLGKADAGDWTEIETDLGKNIEGVADTGFARGFMNFAPEIVEAILSGKGEVEHAATFEDGVKVQKVLDAAHESNQTGGVVKI
ncbi:MAG TPA: Gfo/Idh/MocA family oxidoreductase [Pyrinomonadaceae bacterium]|jgi:predicted dehydrogenase